MTTSTTTATVDRSEDRSERITEGSRPALPHGVQLAGLMPSVSFDEPQWLVERNGQFVQVSELLYRVLEHADGVRTVGEIADAVTATTDWLVDAPSLRHLIETKLAPVGLLTAQDASPGLHAVTPLPSASALGASPLGLTMRMKMLSPRFIQTTANGFQHLFHPALAVIPLACIGAAHIWMYTTVSVSAAVYSVLYTPGALVSVFAIVMIAGLFHELGHAAALRYGGGHVRGIGVGLYLIFPAFYTDVTDSYKLGRAARLRTDLGGVYFHALFASGLIALAALTSSQVLLLCAVLINVDIARQFIPFVRLDGYWILADLTGIPDFFSQMGPFVRSVVRLPRWKGARLPKLRPAARAVFAVYTLAVVPVLVWLLGLMVVRLPWFVRATSEALVHQAQLIEGSRSAVTWLLAGAQMVLLSIPLLGTVLILGTIVIPVARALSSVAQRVVPPPVRYFAGGIAAASIAFAAIGWVSQQRGPAGNAAAEATPATAAPVQSDAAASAVQRARDALASADSFTASVEGQFREDPFTGDLSLERPNRARIDIAGSEEGLGTILIAAKDGETSVYFPADNQFARFAAGADGRNITAFIVDHVRHFFRPETLGATADGGRLSYRGAATVDGIPSDIVDIVPPSGKGHVARYFVSSADGLVHRLEWRNTAGEAPTRWLRLKNARRGIPIDRARFDLRVPKDATPLQLPLSLDIPGVAPGSGEPSRTGS